MQIGLTLPLILVATLSGLPTPRTAKSADQTNPTRLGDPVTEADVREAVLRYQMASWLSQAEKDETNAKSSSDKQIAGKSNFTVYFISIDGRDPSDSFIQRFHDISRTVKTASEAKQDNIRSSVHDRKSRQLGIIFSADSIHWMKNDSVEVDGGYQCGGLCSGGYTYSLQFEGGKWVVKSAKMTFVS